MAVTAYPVIYIDSTDGAKSDSACSGAGPATALTGSSASTDGGGTVVTLDGSPDLTNVATDGSHVIYLVDSTAGHRNFAAINAKDNGAKTVTVEQAFTGSLSGKSWAIGGVRATIGSSSSRLLGDNNAASGDAMPGWTIELKSGHTETFGTPAVRFYRAGDATTGVITVRGAAGAATMPVLTQTANTPTLEFRSSYFKVQNIELANSNGSKSSTMGLSVLGSSYMTIENIRVTNLTNYVAQGIYLQNGATELTLRDCIVLAASTYALRSSSFAASTISNCVFAGATAGNGMYLTGALAMVAITNNIIAFNSGSGILAIYAGGATGINCRNNIFHGNGGSGYENNSASTNTSQVGSTFVNNQFTLNGAYGINYSGAGITEAHLRAIHGAILNNNFYGNTSGKYSSNITISVNETTTDPSGGLASATKDYAGTTGGTNFNSTVHKDLGYPSGGTAIPVGTTSSSQAYQDIGLGSQHAAAGGLLFPSGLTGGFHRG